MSVVSACALLHGPRAVGAVLLQGREESWVGKEHVCMSVPSGRNDK